MSRLGFGIGAQIRKRSRINGYVTEVDGKHTHTHAHVFWCLRTCIFALSSFR